MTEADAKVPLLDQPLAKATETRKEEVCIVRISIEENENKQVMEKHISIVGSDSNSSSSPKTYKPDLISIGPYYYIKEPAASGTGTSVKDKFKKSFFGKNEELEEQCRTTLRGLEKFVGPWYAKHLGLDGINGGQNKFELVEMLLLDGCFILEFFYKWNSSSPQDEFKDVDDAEVVEGIRAFMRDDKKVVQTLTDLLLLESQFPFFILFELHKLKKSRYSSDAAAESDDHHHHNNNNNDKDNALLEKFMKLVKKHNGNPLQNELKEFVKEHAEDDAWLKQVNLMKLVREHKYEEMQKELGMLTRYDAGALLNKLIELVKDYELRQDLMVMVKKTFVDHVPKLTPQNVGAHEYYRPKHLLQLVHWLCTPPRPSKRNHTSGGNRQQINTATELEQDGVRLKKIGKVYSGYYCDDDKEKPAEFNANDGTTLFDIDFSWGRLKIPCFKIEESTETFFRNMIAFEQHSESGRGPKYFTDFAWCMGQLIRSQSDVNLLRRRGIIVNLLATDDIQVAKMFQKMSQGIVLSSTFSQVYTKVDQFGQQPWNIWMGKLGQDFFYSPWKLISAIVGGLLVSLGTAVSVKNLLK